MPAKKKKSSKKKGSGPIPTGWMERGARIAGQTGRSAFRFMGTRVKSFADPERASEFLDGFHEQTARQLGIAVGTPVLIIHRTYFDADDRPLVFAQLFCRPDRYQQVVDFVHETNGVKVLDDAS